MLFRGVGLGMIALVGAAGRPRFAKTVSCRTYVCSLMGMGVPSALN